jgi:hypothetical protein
MEPTVHVTRLTLAMFSVMALAGVGLLAGMETGAAAVPAGSAVSSGSSQGAFQPCPCDKPICRPGCLVK